jgi:hypothetical protein
MYKAMNIYKYLVNRPNNRPIDNCAQLRGIVQVDYHAPEVDERMSHQGFLYLVFVGPWDVVEQVVQRVYLLRCIPFVAHHSFVGFTFQHIELNKMATELDKTDNA